MLTTIPYDEGWTVLVDGEEHPKEKLLDAFVGVALTPGTHKISMSYRPEGLVKGGMITIGCVVLLLAVECICRFWRRRRWEEEKIWEEEVGEEEISEGEIPEQE